MRLIDRAISYVSPSAGLSRARARMALRAVERHYEGASTGRRADGWHRAASDVNAAMGPSLARVREVARDLGRNNSYARSLSRTIKNSVVGSGIKPDLTVDGWEQWASTTQCDAAGVCSLSGLQKLVMAGVVESGEMLIRVRWRRPEDGLALPLQLQILEPDYIDTSKCSRLPNGGRIVYGIEFDAIGRRVAYWLYREHPGEAAGLLGSYGTGQSYRVDASEIAHMYEVERAGQVRGMSMYAPAIVRFKDFDAMEDATLVKQKVAACLTVLTTDTDGTSSPLGRADETKSPAVDSLEPGAVLNLPSGRDVEIVDPPSTTDYAPYTQTQLRAIAAGFGVSYEDMTGDYTNLPFSAARMSRLRFQSHVDGWRRDIIITQMMDAVWGWVVRAAAMQGTTVSSRVSWTAPALPMIEPDKEGLAFSRNIRAGCTTLSEELRARGWTLESFIEEYRSDIAALDAAGLVLDIDARKMTQAGQAMNAMWLTGASPTSKATESEKAKREMEHQAMGAV